MYKLILLFHQPEDLDAFETSWSEHIVPAVEALPNIRRVSVSRVHGGPDGNPDLYLIHEFFFDDEECTRAAMTSDAGQRAGRTLMAHAANNVTVCFSQHVEEDRPVKASDQQGGR